MASKWQGPSNLEEAVDSEVLAMMYIALWRPTSPREATRTEDLRILSCPTDGQAIISKCHIWDLLRSQAELQEGNDAMTLRTARLVIRPRVSGPESKTSSSPRPRLRRSWHPRVSRG
ncbi:hypothetical protein QYE76_065707 [Lolium multiflorum]|uniref:Uncharacterized protein n=1 Tax=Lolium multiflorum TaxID=4521 RepID=A0AAD8S9A3_LOLMU|nr:hypothetical protein QYE76_065707 [Lolium multiflorum]